VDDDERLTRQISVVIAVLLAVFFPLALLVTGGSGAVEVAMLAVAAVGAVLVCFGPSRRPGLGLRTGVAASVVFYVALVVVLVITSPAPGG